MIIVEFWVCVWVCMRVCVSVVWCSRVSYSSDICNQCYFMYITSFVRAGQLICRDGGGGGGGGGGGIASKDCTTKPTTALVIEERSLEFHTHIVKAHSYMITGY